MKSKIYSGNTTNGGSTTVNISSLGLSSVNDYFVILNVGGPAATNQAINGYITDKTATSFKVTTTGQIAPFSAQVVYNA